MSIENVKKISVMAHISDQDELVDALQRLGTIHVEQFDPGDGLIRKELTEDELMKVREYSYRISEADFAIEFLKENRREKPGFLKALVKPKYPMTVEEFLRFEERFNLQSIYRECSELERKLITLRETRSAYEREASQLQMWKEVDMPLKSIAGGRAFGLITEVIANRDLPGFIDDLDREAPESALEVIEDDGRYSSCVIVFHVDSEEAVRAALASRKHRSVAFSEEPVPPFERIRIIEQGIKEIEGEWDKVLDRVDELSLEEPGLTIARELFQNRKNSVEIMTSFGHTDSTMAFEGWVTEAETRRTRERLEMLAMEVGVEIADPGEVDNPPVSLKNHRLIKPFELLTKLYGTPSNMEYDPTWIIAVSFVVFFGFCIGDVGYGIVLVAAFLMMRRFIPVGKTVKDLFLVMSYGAGFAVFVGVLTGSWFGIATENLPAFMRNMAVFDPLAHPIPLMVVCMGLGVIHMTAGTVVEFRDNWRQGRRVDAIIDQGLVFMMLLCLPVAVILSIAGLVPKNVALAIGAAPIAGMFLLLGRGAKSVPGKAVNGLYETYNTLIGWMGDTISYLRLYALGMATFVIGWVINTLAGMVGGIAPVIGIVLMLVILIIGHTFNVVINLLGAFVHPLRLEFVEFFGKFYEDGGREFTPLGIDSKVVIIKDNQD